jgi:hypothetical protein
MASIEWTNMREVMAGIKAREEKLKSAPKIARQMGVLALNEIHPLTNKLYNTWDNSIHAEVNEIRSFVWELWVGSKGAFAGKDGKGSPTDNGGYNYGKRQEDLYHPIEIGWHKAWPRMVDLWRTSWQGLASNLVSTGDDNGGGFGETMGNDFSMMGGF